MKSIILISIAFFSLVDSGYASKNSHDFHLNLGMGWGVSSDRVYQRETKAQLGNRLGFRFHNPIKSIEGMGIQAGILVSRKGVKISESAIQELWLFTNLEMPLGIKYNLLSRGVFWLYTDLSLSPIYNFSFSDRSNFGTFPLDESARSLLMDAEAALGIGAGPLRFRFFYQHSFFSAVKEGTLKVNQFGLDLLIPLLYQRNLDR